MRRFFLFILLFLRVIDPCKSQSIVAGQVAISDYYFDINPDTELIGNASFSLDADKDNIVDLILNTGFSFADPHHLYAYAKVIPQDSNQVSYSHNVTVYNPGFGNTTTHSVAKSFNSGDTISDDSSFVDSWWRALNYYAEFLGMGTFTIQDWTIAGEKYIGFRLIQSADTSFGWIRIFTTGYSHIVVKDYAINNHHGIGIKETEAGFIFIYPNPSKNIFFISTNHTFLNAEVTLFNTFGQSVFEKSFSFITSKTKIELSPLQDGIYFVKINSGTSSFSQKLLIRN